MAFTCIFQVPIPWAAVVHFAVTVTIIAVKSIAIWRFDPQNLIDDVDRFSNEFIIRRFNSKPYELEKSGVNDLSFVGRARVVVKLDLFARIGLTVLRDPQIIISVTVFAGSRRGPSVD